MCKLRSLYMLSCIILPALALAQPPQITTAPNLTNETQKTTSDFLVTAFIDASYNYLQNSNEFTSTSFNRVFDIAPNGFRLQQAGFTLAYQPKQGFGVLINPILGRDPFIFAPYGWDPNYGSDWNGFALPQAYLQYSTGSFTLMGGSFVELAGAESLFSQDDTNFSRSILYGYAEPFTVLGLRASYIANEKLKFYGGINNGWDSIRDTSRHPTLELGMTYTFNPTFSLATYGYTGQQRIADRTSSGPKGSRTLFDIIATINVTNALSFVANYDYALQTKAALPNGDIAKAVWQGIAVYANYKFDENWRTSVRVESFDDQDGYRTGVSQHWNEATITVGYSPIKNLEIRAEARRDFSNHHVFVDKNGISVHNNQQSIALETVYKFS